MEAMDGGGSDKEIAAARGPGEREGHEILRKQLEIQIEAIALLKRSGPARSRV